MKRKKLRSNSIIEAVPIQSPVGLWMDRIPYFEYILNAYLLVIYSQQLLNFQKKEKPKLINLTEKI